MIEQNKVSPSVASLQKLLSVYELPLSRFFAEEAADAERGDQGGAAHPELEAARGSP